MSAEIEGLFGPRSQVWDKNGESIVFAAAGRAAMLQLAHPAVAQAVDEFSITRADRLGRFRNTFYYVFAMVFGERRTAQSMADKVHRMHERVRGVIEDDDAGPFFPRGTPYQANDPHAQLWVASTLFDSSAWAYETFVRPLREAERAQWVSEFPRFTSLFTVPESIVPRSWPAFRAYNRRMWASDVLTVSSTARELKDVLCESPSRALAPLWRWYVNLTAGSLPARLREDFGFSWGAADRAMYRATKLGIRNARRALPHRLRRLPVYHRAMARVGGYTPRPVDRLLDALLFGRSAVV